MTRSPDRPIGRFDVAVVGAGPAGSIAAWTLARGGARVAIVDGSHPREKPCGGGVTGRALALVAGALDGASLAKVTIAAARFEGPDGTGASVQLQTEPGCGAEPHVKMIVAARAAFDAALLDAACRAGAVLVGERVRDLSIASDTVSVLTPSGTLSAGCVIGADGANSLVRRRVARPFRREQLSIGTGYYAHGIASDEIIIRFVADPPGYIWSFPRPGHLAIGICAQAHEADAGALRQACADWIRDARVAPDARLDAYSWPIPSLHAQDFGAETCAGSRWMLAGDAAGLVDPITREGIYFALLSGIWSAEALLRSNGGAAAQYRARLHDEVYPELRRAARLKAGFFQPRFMRLLIAALRESDGIRRVMADLIAGVQPYRGLRRRLIATREIRLAFKYVAQVFGPASRSGAGR